MLVIPFFAFTAAYRAMSTTALFVFAGQLALIPVGVLLLAQVRSIAVKQLFTITHCKTCSTFLLTYDRYGYVRRGF